MTITPTNENGSSAAITSPPHCPEKAESIVVSRNFRAGRSICSAKAKKAGDQIIRPMSIKGRHTAEIPATRPRLLERETFLPSGIGYKRSKIGVALTDLAADVAVIPGSLARKLGELSRVNALLLRCLRSALRRGVHRAGGILQSVCFRDARRTQDHHLGPAFTSAGKKEHFVRWIISDAVAFNVRRKLVVDNIAVKVDGQH